MTRPIIQQRPFDFATDGRDTSRWWALSGRADWCTPEGELALVRRTFGGPTGTGVIDLDPCSNPWSRTRARVECMLERGQNGLVVPWRGKTFSNPPYGVGEIELFTARARLEAELLDRSLHQEARDGRARARFFELPCSETILLVPANTETRWYHRDCAVADALCIRKGRIQFRKPPWIEGDADWMAQARRLAAALQVAELRQLLDEVGGWESAAPDDEGDRSTVANLWVYWGPRPEWFVEVYKDQGHAFVTDAGRARL